LLVVQCFHQNCYSSANVAAEASLKLLVPVVCSLWIEGWVDSNSSAPSVRATLLGALNLQALDTMGRLL